VNGSRQELAYQDVNGDGFVDQLISTENSELRVALNRTGRTNLLKSVARPLGGKFELAYERSGNTYEHPHSRWVMNRVTMHDGHPGDGPDTLTTTFDYRDEQGRKAGIYNRLEREFYGYPVVIQEQGEADGADPAASPYLRVKGDVAYLLT
jgi:hypothetical protein